MKKFLLIAGVLVAATLRVSTADGSIILFDYGNDGAAPTLGGTWNTFTSPTGGGLLDTGGNITGLTISFGSGIETLGGDQGTWSSGDNEWVDADATRDGFSTRSGTANTTVTISGLQAGSIWRFDHVAVRNRSASSRVADYTVNGQFADSTPNGDNFNARSDGWDAGNILKWDSVVADQNGEIILAISNESSFGYLNASRLSAVPEPTSTAMFGLALLSMVLRKRIA